MRELFLPGDLICEFNLDIELTNGNDGRTKSYYKPARERKKYERYIKTAQLTRTCTLSQIPTQPFEHRVVVVVSRVLGRGQRMFDSSSLGRGNWKGIEDALVACGVFHDDSPQWIANTIFHQDVQFREVGPYTTVSIHHVADQ